MIRPQTVEMHGAALPQVQDLAFPCTELQTVPVVPIFQLVEVPLNGSTHICSISPSYGLQTC